MDISKIMDSTLTPKSICSDVYANRLTKSLAKELLISLIEGSDDPNMRSESFKALKTLNIKEPSLFKFVENYQLSDENPLVRKAATEFIGTIFAEESLNTLIWALQNDKSPLVIQSIFSLIQSKNNESFKELRKELNYLLKDIANSIGITQAEAEFILGLEVLFAQYIKNYELELESYHKFQNIWDSKLEEYWFKIQNNHITSLSFTFFNWNYLKKYPHKYKSISKLKDPEIFLYYLRKSQLENKISITLPNSIGALSFLRKLSLKHNELKEIPSSIWNINTLEMLDLSHNNISEFPQGIAQLKSLKRFKINDNPLRNIPDSIHSYLNSLEYLKV